MATLFTIIGVIVACVIGIAQVEKKVVRAILAAVIVIGVIGIAYLFITGEVGKKDSWISNMNTSLDVITDSKDSAWYTSSEVSADGKKWTETISTKNGTVLYFRLTYKCIAGSQTDVIFVDNLGEGLDFVDDYVYVVRDDEVEKISWKDAVFDATEGDIITLYYRVKVTETGMLYNDARTGTSVGTQYDKCKIEVE